MTNKLWGALNKQTKKQNFNRLLKLTNFATRCILLEAALVTLFLSRRLEQQYERMPAELSEDVEWIFCPIEKTNEILRAIFRDPYDPIRVKLTFIPTRPGEVIDHTHYNVGCVNHKHGMKVVGLWDDSPVLFREKEFDFTFENITVTKRSESEIPASRLEVRSLPN